MEKSDSLNDKSKPNLFQFAISELSQDAFLAWFFSWIDADPSHPISSAAKKCLSTFLNPKTEDKSLSNISEKDIQGCEVQRQVHIKGQKRRKENRLLQ
jgi:hypothetical protein